MQFRRRIPSPTALIALEAVIRHRGITSAARELGVTQAAVSRQIGLLEKDFGRPLFTRGHRAVVPTASCLVLGSALAESLNAIADAVDVVRADSTDVVTIGATIAFASFWLLPRLAAFRKAHPEVQIRVISQDAPFSLRAGEADIAFRYGTPPFGDGVIVAKRADVVCPVCSPSYAAQHDLARFPIGTFDLIETETSNRSWYRWSDWFSRTGQHREAHKAALRFSHYTETISASCAGQGIALGWHVLISQHLDAGTLVKIGDVELDPLGFHSILTPANARRSATCDLVRDWLSSALQQAE